MALNLQLHGKTASGEFVIIKGPQTAPDIFHVPAAQQKWNVKFNVYTVRQKDSGGVLWDKERCTIRQKIQYVTQEIKKESVLIYL